GTRRHVRAPLPDNPGVVPRRIPQAGAPGNTQTRGRPDPVAFAPPSVGGAWQPPAHALQDGTLWGAPWPARHWAATTRTTSGCGGRGAPHARGARARARTP